MKKNKAIFSISLIVLAGIAVSFDWPVKDVEPQKLFSKFGQLRGETISNSVIFMQEKEIESTDIGRVSLVITEHNSDGNWFESTLGNAVIIAHEDNLMTIYGNLEENPFPETSEDSIFVQTGTKIGYTGKSAWTQNDDSTLEFQISDSKNNAFINPLILMPRISAKNTLSLAEITLENKNGRKYDLNAQKSIPAGTYSLYKKRSQTEMPYKTSVYVNGSETESVVYEMLEQKDGRLCALGRDYYAFEKIYPDNDRLFIGHVMLPHGNDTLTVLISDILGNEKSVTYNIVAY